MKVVRMMLIVLVFALAGGGFGAAIGALVGYGLPNSIPVHYGEDAAERTTGTTEVWTIPPP